ncbi:hypothetical protein CEXT_735831 [Caerostris extrusa]|uniref:Uncharacterized protein n=1 Tax=Caerostris extrusa TaxID=172846 RepID=A0AAV4NYR5_CAEEX|nr:hypothetical protein CEXT_735831 [Caerostris extrusa]
MNPHLVEKKVEKAERLRPCSASPVDSTLLVAVCVVSSLPAPLSPSSMSCRGDPETLSSALARKQSAAMLRNGAATKRMESRLH